MAREIKYYIVAANAPAGDLREGGGGQAVMQTGEADTVGAATKMALAQPAAPSISTRTRCSPSTI